MAGPEPSAARTAAVLFVLGPMLLLTALSRPASAALPSDDDIVPPTLRFESSPQLTPQVEELQQLDPRSLVPILQLVGLRDAGAPIHVQVVPEGSPKARLMPSWAVAYAVGNAGTVVMVPSRVPSYPDDSLSAVLRHEVAHVLVARAAGYRPVPRWFNEGLATVAGRRWSLKDRGLVVLAAIPRRGLTLQELDEDFHAGAVGARRAYSLSADFVRWLLEQDGADTGARVLRHVARGDDFDAAFRAATGRSLGAAERAYWRQLNLWSRWIPLVGSSSFLWLVITMLALFAFRRRRQRDEEQRRRWQEEEELHSLLEARERLGSRNVDPPGGPWIH